VRDVYAVVGVSADRQARPAVGERARNARCQRCVGGQTRTLAV